MTFLPIVARELRVASRLRGTYWSRFAAAILGAGLAAEFLSVSRQQPVAVIGAILFRMLATVLFIYAALAGTRLTSDCISAEKREGTLGLLFLTDLKGYDVVFGKLAATSINAFYGMLAVVPVMAISMLLGGVTKNEFWRVVLVAVNLLFFFLSAGLFASAICRQHSRSFGVALLLVSIIVGGFPFLAALHSQHHPNSDYQIMLFPSPAYGCFAAFDSYSGSAKFSYFWPNVLVTHLYGWLFLMASCWIVPRSWQDSASRRRVPLPKAIEAWRARPRRHLLDINPFLWRADYGPVQSLKPWVIVGMLCVFWFWISGRFEVEMFDPAKDIFFLITVNTVLKVQLAGEASRALAQDRRSGALELVLTTPLTEADIIQGQRLALWRQFAGPVAFAFLANLLCLAMEPRVERDDGTVALHISLGIFLLLDLNALSWTSMWFALKAKTPATAALRALAVVLILPLGIFMIAVPVLNTLSHFEWPGPIVVVGLLGMVIDLGFWQNAKLKLRAEFRNTVTERFFSKVQRSSTANPATSGR